jgi:hypothetical protein
MDEILERLRRNIGRLANSDEDRQMIAELFAQKSSIGLQKEAAGWNNILLDLAGNEIAYHRSYDPFSEASVKFDENSNPDYLICFGTGFGYHLPNLVAKAKDVPKVILVETRFEALYIFMTELDLDVFLPQGYEILYAPEPKMLSEYINVISPRYHSANISIIALDVYSLFINNYIAEVSERLQESKQRHETFYHSLKKQHGQISRNVKDNIPFLRKSAAFQPGSGKGQRALLVASGPSLERHLPVVKAMQDYVQIVCVGSALPVLLEHEIKPDLVVISDPQSVNSLHFPEESYDLDLAFDLAVPKEVQGKFTGHKIITNVGHKISQFILADIPIVKLSGWGTVTSSALSICELAQFDEVLLIGTELSFIGTKTHASNYKIVSQPQGAFEIKDILDNKVETTYVFEKYADYLSTQISDVISSGINVVNCCDGGLLRNCEIKSLRHCFNGIKNENKKKSPWLWYGKSMITDDTIVSAIEKLDDDVGKMSLSVEKLKNGELSINSLMSIQPFGAFEGKYLDKANDLEEAIIKQDWTGFNRAEAAILTAIRQEVDSFTRELTEAMER